jgi:hypothetical protein
MKKYNSHLLIFLFFFFGNSISINAQNLSMTIELDKKEFVEGESIYLLLTMKNNASIAQEIDPFNIASGPLKILVENQQKEIIPYYGIKINGMALIRNDTLISGESAQYVCNISANYPNIIEKGVMVPSQILTRLSPGAYKVKAVFSVTDKLIISNEIVFSVIAPQGEDVKVLEILKEKLRPDYLYSISSSEKITFFKDLATSYPQSTYLPRILRTIATCWLEKGDTIEAGKVLKSVILRNPNTGHAIEAFMATKLLGKGEQAKMLKEIKLLFPESRMMKYGERILKSTQQ